MNRCVYTVLYYLLLPFIFFRLLWRSIKAPQYARRWPERLGFFRAPDDLGGLWLHSVSVGETVAAAPLIRQIRKDFPELPVVITTMTPTGSERVKTLFGDSVFHVYVPYDIPGAVNRFLERVKPRLTLIMETELWPNLVHCCHQKDIPLVVVNARLSERSARGYRKFPSLSKEMLGKIDLIAAQTAGDGERFVGLGLAQKRLVVTGSIKFDIEIPQPVIQSAEALRNEWGDHRPVWVAASTHEGEDGQILAAHKQLLKDNPSLLLLLVPRHPERFDQVARLVKGEGFSSVRRSLAESVAAGVSVMLCDTMGELLLFYAASDVAFVGGTLVETGGHNFLEPAAIGVPIVSGPYRFNFSEISRLLITAGAMITVDQGDQLAEAVQPILGNPDLKAKMAAAGQKVVAENRGAQQRVLDQVKVFLRRSPSATG